MKAQLYLNLKTSWQSIWEVVRTWILNNKNTQFKPKGDLPQRRPSGVREWAVAGERLKAIQLESVLKVTYDKTREGVTWHNEIYFKRAKRSIFTRITVEPQGASELVEVKTPRIVAVLQKRFGNMNEQMPLTRQNGKGSAGRQETNNGLSIPFDAQGRLKVVLDGATPSGVKAICDAVKDKNASTEKSKRNRKSGVRAKNGELTQVDVAKDFGVSRKTVNKWESEQTEDGPNNESNPYGYYRALRIDPNLRGAYEQLAGMAKLYRRQKAEAKKKDLRFRMTFVSFNERMLEHNQKK